MTAGTDLMAIAGTNVTVKSGANTMVEAAASVRARAGDDLSLLAGKSTTLESPRGLSVLSDQVGVTTKKFFVDSHNLILRGQSIDITSSGKINMRGASEVVIKGQKITQN